MPTLSTGEIRPGIWLPPVGRRVSLGRDDGLPPPPFALSLTNSPTGYIEPFTVRSMVTGQSVAGIIESRVIAEAIRDALNSAAARGILGIEG